MKENLFSYGTLQKDEVQIELFGRLLGGTKEVLRGFKIATIEITDANFLAKGEDRFQKTLIRTNDENDSVEGVSLEFTREELLLADGYEPENYKRLKVKLESGAKAWIYVAVEN